MARDTSLPLRQAIVTRLRADAGLTALVPAARVYGERSPPDPPYPFVRYGVAIVGQTDGGLTIHVFSQSPFTDEAAGIAAAIVESLDDTALALADGRTAHLAWPESAGTQIVADPKEADIWHGIVRFNATMPRPCAS